MKVAIPTIGGILDEFLTSCEVFTILAIDDDNKVNDTEIMCTPQGCDCKCNIAYLLQQKGVTVMLVGNIGKTEIDALKKHDIMVHKGFSGHVSKISEEFLSGTYKNFDKNIRQKRNRGSKKN
jgi:predicted Fe-Mo cluster-binding NifX family protein